MINLICPQPSSKYTGFTLIELVLSVIITAMVTTLAGTGLVTMINANSASETRILNRLELNRAIDLIQDEVKMSAGVFLDVTTTPSEFIPLGNSPQPILVILPYRNHQSRETLPPIVYYVTDIVSTEPWKEPRAIYRWGPKLLVNGDYDPTIYEHELVIDGITDRPPDPNPACPSITDQSIPNNIDRQGFFICLNPTEKNIKLWLLRLTDQDQQTVIQHQINYLNVL